MRDQAVVIGNGRSRLNFDLNRVRERFVTYGCNALHRDFIPDTLVSMDFHMVHEILNARTHHKCRFVTQHTNDVDLLAGNGEPIHFIQHCNSTPDSGTAALDLACKDGHKIIYIVGFDYHNGGFNNVYAGTHNYASKSHSTPTSQDTSWKSRLHKIVDKYKEVQFIKITDIENDSTKPNFQHMTIEQFRELLC